ncbi:MAG: metallophosphoesterase family protein [Anaerolineae bacterium]|jgi:predicted phosphodiesterase|nr:metallophosphoesterase family protein [Anaerolineae bacterium]
MKLAVLSDIHGNLIALEAVLADLAQESGIDQTWCLGDLAVFGPRPAECIQRIKALNVENEGKTFRVIGGNTDRYLVTGERYPLPALKEAEGLAQRVHDLTIRDTIHNWNLGRLSWEEYEFLAKIRGHELYQMVNGYGVVIGYHAVPGDDEPMLRPDTPDEQARDYLLDREGCLAIGGHTHVQMDRQLGPWRAINVGSVGLSWQYPGMAQYAVIVIQEGQVTIDLRNIPYDVEACIADLYAVDHPAPTWFIEKIRPQPKDS